MMSTPTKMNVFLQRMLKKNDDECPDKIVMETNQQQVEDSRRSKSKWLRKFSASPNKYKSFSTQPIASPVRCTDPMPMQRATTFPTPQDTPDLGHIIKEFEINYLSPTKQITQQEPDKTGKFVKKMVAAFEQKYKNFKEPVNEVAENRYKRRSLPSVSAQHAEARKNFFNETYVINHSPEIAHDTLDITASDSPLDETIDLSRSIVIDEDLSSTPVKPHDSTLKFVPLPKVPTNVDCERTPKIVGAFLKKPIEVEDTSIDWIPITGKKLPRKHSFKKLLSILTGRKSSNKDKASKLFCSQSQNNLHEEPPKEHHDSGFEEKSSSTSSLTSLASFSDILQHQDNYLPEMNKRTSVTTFRSAKETKKSVESTEFVDFKDEEIYSDTSSISSKRFIFEEIPRSEVRLSLGPSFPLKNVIMRQASESSLTSDIEDIDDYDFDDDESETPVASPLPKHPFISSKDDLDKDELESSGSSGHSSQDVTQVEFRRSYWKFDAHDGHYDTPRSYLSRSDPGLSYFSPRSSNSSFNSSFEAPVYDIPTVKLPPRPKSSVYEDALSLKRRNANVSSVGVTTIRSQFYAFQSEEEPHYATVKPRNIKILPSKDLLRSMANVSPNCRTPVSHYMAFNQLAGF